MVSELNQLRFIQQCEAVQDLLSQKIARFVKATILDHKATELLTGSKQKFNLLQFKITKLKQFSH